VNYLAITHLTAKWLVEKKQYLDAVADELERLSGADSLLKMLLSVGSFRAAASPDGRLLAVWNRDYLSNKGDESWGVIRLEGPYGLLSNFLPEVFERELQIIHTRIEGLLLDPRWIHHSRGEGIHTIIAGRGEVAREFRVLYGDRDLTSGAAVSRAVACLGPAREDESFAIAARRDYELLPLLARTANGLVSSSALRPVVAGTYFVTLQERFIPASAEPSGVIAPALPVPALQTEPADMSFLTDDWSYDDWTAPGSPLTPTQRRILESDIADRQPLRMAGAAGSGKTLLMMLLAIRILRRAGEKRNPLRVLYVVHNAAMEAKVWMQFVTLGAGPFLAENAEQILEVRTLFEYSRSGLEVEGTAVFDPDAHESKSFQTHIVSECLRDVLDHETKSVANSKLLSEVKKNEELFPVFVSLTADEIGLAIKGHALADDRKTYVASERRLSRFHGILSGDERNFVFDVFEAYRRQVFEEYQMFDTDDLAVSLLAKLTTPIWGMQRRKAGYDYVFVDETQLFNENERRLFPLLTRGTTNHVPVVLALDEAQQTRGAVSAGLGLLGFDHLSNEALESVHRSTASILRLAFFVIQRTTDLFGAEFPDFTGTTQPVVSDSHHLAERPKLLRASQEGVGLECVRQIQNLRGDNIRQICIVCHAERYWDEINRALLESRIPFIRLNQRGERLDKKRPLVAVGRPDTVGGQEFDAVVAVGLEQGVVPPRVSSNQPLSLALEQQALREMYVSFTRARYRLVLVNSFRSSPTRIIAEAGNAGYIAAAVMPARGRSRIRKPAP